MNRLILRFLIAIVSLLFLLPLQAATVTVAAAADLKFALDDLVREFEGQNPTEKIQVTYGSSGNFFAQLQNNAPFDLFLSADLQYPEKLVEAGFAADTNVFRYAVGRIVVWTQKESPLDLKKLGIRALLDPSVRKIAIANPTHAPYGRAAVAALKTLKVYGLVESRLVYGENIAQTAQFVQSGAAEIGILALSLALAPPLRNEGRYWEVPPEAYPKMEQGGIILKRARDLKAARDFRDFILGERGRVVLKRFGFSLAEK